MILNNTFISNDNLLSYSCEIPVEHDRIGILFVHAANSTKLGPHRMYVEMSRIFMSMGYPTFRFDMRGCGDSSGKYNEIEITPDISDTLAAINKFVEHAQLDKVILVGISKGARVCYNIMLKHKVPLAGMILLSTSVINNTNAIKYSFGHLKTYINKLSRLSTLGRLFKGDIDMKQIIKTIISPINISRHQGIRPKSDNHSRCPILLIYGDKDPIFKTSYKYYTDEFTKNNIAHKCHIISGANHSFYHYKWKEEIIKVSSEWLMHFSEKGAPCLR